jgi:hypothetical protein
MYILYTRIKNYRNPRTFRLHAGLGATGYVIHRPERRNAMFHENSFLLQESKIDWEEYRPLKGNRYFGGIRHLHFQVWRLMKARNQHEAGSKQSSGFILVYLFLNTEMDVICSSETSFDFPRAAWRYIPEDSTTHNHWPRDTLYPLKLALTSLTSGGLSVGILRWRTKTLEFVWLYYYYYYYYYYYETSNIRIYIPYFYWRFSDYRSTVVNWQLFILCPMNRFW